MILIFADVHLGIKSYSSFDNKGLMTAEHEARTALSEIYLRACKSDIDMIVCLGDFFHTNQPSTENISYAISWFHKIDLLNKPFFIIPGNHDAAMYSNSLAFLNALNLNNTKLLIKDKNFEYKYIWKGWNLHFIPYSYSETMKNKEDTFHSEVEEAISSADQKTIVLSHIQETTAKIGAESLMISKGVDIIDIDNIHQTKDIILLSGHMHKHQIYKKGFMTVCYPGSCFYHDLSDCNQSKGYCILDQSGNITFESITSIRKFISLYIPEDTDFEFLLENRRLPKNSVIFISLKQEKNILIEDKIKKLLEAKNCILGNIKWNQDEDTLTENISLISNIDPYKLLQESLDSKKDLELNLKKDTLNKGYEYLDASTGVSI
jgi:DNA repair exonuclease SbcCD nuclease subunit